LRAELALDVREALLEVAEKLVAALLDASEDVVQAPVDTGCSRVRAVREPLVEHRLSVVGELGDRAIELAREPLGRVVAGRLDRGGELLDGGLGEPIRGSVEDSRQVLALAELHGRA